MFDPACIGLTGYLLNDKARRVNRFVLMMRAAEFEPDDSQAAGNCKRPTRFTPIRMFGL